MKDPLNIRPEQVMEGMTGENLQMMYDIIDVVASDSQMAEKAKIALRVLLEAAIPTPVSKAV